MVERFFYTEDVGGSIPLAPTNNKTPGSGVLLLVIALGGIELGGDLGIYPECNEVKIP